MESPTSLTQTFINALSDIQLTRYSQLGSSTIIIYDHLITFDKEVNLIWRSPWSAGKLLFFANRYYGLAATIFNNYGFFSRRLTDDVSKHFFLWQGWTGLVACVLAEGIMQMRIYALYSLSKRVLALMLIGFVTSVITSSWVVHSVLDNVTASAAIIPNGKFCVLSNVSRFFLFWVPVVAFECLLCALAIIKGVQTFRSHGSLFDDGRRLIGILIRDSALYFVVITAAYTTCLVMWATQPTSRLELPIGFTVAMSCVLANRTMLNVRQAATTVASLRYGIGRTAATGDIILYGRHGQGTPIPNTFELKSLYTRRVERLVLIPDFEPPGPPVPSKTDSIIIIA
ncbi:hypothetical protein BJ165DRAFT_282735 [Panaeolus papilionaceus]|nr:hypothetical protein BJ165DRAFT_282735 [Panaeolus papilionaceus]